MNLVTVNYDVVSETEVCFKLNGYTFHYRENSDSSIPSIEDKDVIFNTDYIEDNDEYFETITVNLNGFQKEIPDIHLKGCGISKAKKIREKKLNAYIDEAILRNLVKRRYESINSSVMPESEIDIKIIDGKDLFFSANSASFWISEQDNEPVEIIRDLIFHSDEMKPTI